MSENKEFYVMVKGEKVMVTEEVYREYVRPMRRQQRQERRVWRCRIVGRKGNLIRCPYKCGECLYAIAGKLPTGNVLSLDKFKELDVEIENKSLDLERSYIEKEERTSIQEEICKAISMLTPRQQEIVRLVYFEGRTQEEVAVIFGIDGSSVRHAMLRIYARLKKILEKSKKFQKNRHVFKKSVLGKVKGVKETLKKD